MKKMKKMEDERDVNKEKRNKEIEIKKKVIIMKQK